MNGQQSEITGTHLRQRWRALSPLISRRRRYLSVAMIISGLAVLLTGTVLAEGGPSYRLQGSDLAGEFVAQPYWLTPGTIAGRHYRLQAGLLGFTDGAGVTASGYCIDARAHRRHDAVYSVGPRLGGDVVSHAREVRWLLAHAYPNGAPPLGSDQRGLARSGSVVQAAIWHFSDGFDLDPAGAPQVDAAFRRAYDALLERASSAAPEADGGAAITLAPPDRAGVAGHPVPVAMSVRGAGGAPVADGTAVTVVSDAGQVGSDARVLSASGAGRLATLRTTGGRATAWVVAGATVVNLRAAVSLPVAPGRMLVASAPTQRLVETSWGRQAVEAVAQVRFSAPPPSSPPPVVVSPPVVVTPPVVLPPPAAPVPAPPAPHSLTLPSAPPVSVATEVNVPMPRAGHPITGQLVRAVGLSLVGLGLLMSTPLRGRRRAGVRC